MVLYFSFLFSFEVVVSVYSFCNMMLKFLSGHMTKFKMEGLNTITPDSSLLLECDSKDDLTGRIQKL